MFNFFVRALALALGVFLLFINIKTYISNNNLSYEYDNLTSITAVSIFSNGEQFSGFETTQHVGGNNRGQIFSGSGLPPPSAEWILEELPEIQYANDFQIITPKGRLASNMSINYTFSIYNENAESIFDRENLENLSFPSEKGAYALIVWVSESRGNERNSSWSAYSYAFKIKK